MTSRAASQPNTAQPTVRTAASLPQTQPATQSLGTANTTSNSNATSSAAQPARVVTYTPGQVTMTGTNISNGRLSNIPTPTTSVANATFIPTVIIPAKRFGGDQQLDVSLLDDFIDDVSPNARHYPPNFPNRSQRHNTREKIKVLADWIDTYATNDDASYEVLLRAAKLNGMGRNLDLGSDYAVRASTYIAKAIDRQPNSAEANFLYGMMLAEGGGFKEGQKYLDKAVELGYTEAEQSLAQSDLLNDRRGEALERLRNLQSREPNNTMIQQQIQIIESGKYYIWDIAAPDIDVKPVS